MNQLIETAQVILFVLVGFSLGVKFAQKRFISSIDSRMKTTAQKYWEKACEARDASLINMGTENTSRLTKGLCRKTPMPQFKYEEEK